MAMIGMKFFWVIIHSICGPTIKNPIDSFSVLITTSGPNLITRIGPRTGYIFVGPVLNTQTDPGVGLISL